MFDSIETGVDRRDFVKVALAIGGSKALAACLDLERDTRRFPPGVEDPSTLPDRQHRWEEDLRRDMAGNTVLPEHQLILFLEYVGPDPPGTTERERVEAVLTTIERAYQRGTGGDVGAQLNDGLLFMLGYAPSYFDRFDDPLPDDLGLQRPGEVLAELGEDESAAESHDAVFVLSSDFASLLLEVEAGLVGDREELNGIELDTSLEGIFSVAERRTGFIGAGLPRERLDDPVHERIDENAAMSMGFQSGFADNLPPNDRVTLESGPFTDGTTLLVSRLEIDLERWYDRDHKERVELMFSTDHSVEDVGEVGENLGAHSGITEDTVDSIEERAAKHGCMGHSAKTARARDEDFIPTIHRRSESIATDMVKPGVAGFNFSSVQRDIQRFIEVRRAMDPDEYDVDIPEDKHGIVGFLETTSRATFLVPPRRLRALPEPRPEVTSYP